MTGPVLRIGSVHNHRARAKFYDWLLVVGFNIPNLIHPRHSEPSVVMGVGNQIFASAIVGSAAKLVSPGSILAGGVEVGENMLVGMGVTVYLGVRIGSNVVISNGSNIKKDVPDGSVIRTGTQPH